MNLERPIFFGDTIDAKLPPVKNTSRWVDTMLADQQMLFEVAAETFKKRDDAHLERIKDVRPVTTYAVGDVVLVAPPRTAMGRVLQGIVQMDH